MRFVYFLIIMLLSIPNLVALEPELFSNTNFTLNEKSPNFFEFNGETYVVGDDDAHGVELMKIDTLTDKLELVIDINEDGDSNPFILTKLGDKFIFVTRDEDLAPTKFWSSDGTEEGTTLLLEFERSYYKRSLIDRFIIRDNILYFQNIGEIWDELWVTDGTAEGSKNLSNDYNDFNFLDMVLVGNNIIFQTESYESFHQKELWSLDNNNNLTKLGSYLIKNPGWGNNWYIKSDNLLYFTARNKENEESTDLWATDGTKNGLSKAYTFNNEANIDFEYYEPIILNNKLFFYTLDSDGWENGLWISDGTESGTFDAKKIGIDTDNIHIIEFEGIVNNRLLISIIDNVNFNTTLWSTDGSANGTYNLTDIDPISFNPWNKNEINNYLYFFRRNAGKYSVWRTDGTPGSASQIIDIPKTEHSDSYYPTMFNFNTKSKIHFASRFEEFSDLYSLDVSTKELRLINSYKGGGTLYIKYVNDIVFMLNTNDEGSTLYFYLDYKTHVIDYDKKSNKTPYYNQKRGYYDLELQKSGDHIYFFADYEGDETYELYRFENPASGITSVEDFESNYINFYPNPTNNNLTLELEEMTDILLVDINGNQVLSFNDFTGGVIDISKLATGFYSITNNNGKLLGKFIKVE